MCATDVGKPTRIQLRVLIVDDNVDAADSLCELLQLDGYLCAVAYEPQAALQRIKLEGFDAAILDIALPGLSGFDLARAIRSMPHGSSMLLIALTGYGSDDAVLLSQNAGFNVHFKKPVDLRRLNEVLQGFQARRVVPERAHE